MNIKISMPAVRRSINPRLSKKPVRYVGTQDLRDLLKLAVGLHSPGSPSRRLRKSLSGLMRLTKADAWSVAMFAPKGESVIFVCSGGDRRTARSLKGKVTARTAMTALAQRRRVSGRVSAVLEGKSVHSLLNLETGEARTWISIARDEGAGEFSERERRLVALYHSQTAWLLAEVVASGAFDPSSIR